MKTATNLFKTQFKKSLIAFLPLALGILLSGMYNASACIQPGGPIFYHCE